MNPTNPAGRVAPPGPNAAVRVHRATVLAIALALGITAGWNQPWPLVWPGLIAAGVLLVAAAIIRWRRPKLLGLAMFLLSVSMAALGAGWVTLQHEFATTDDLAAQIGDEAVLVRVRGVALGAPVLRARTGGVMARFDYRQPSTYFPLRVQALLAREGAATPVRGEVLVRVDESVPPFRAGDQIQAVGFLRRPGAPRNPGEFDYREYAKSLGQAGFLTVARRELITATPADHNAIMARFLNWREDLRRRAGAWLLADLPQTPQTSRDALLASLLLGQRDEQIDGVYGAFQRVGLAHILAISGFHLAVLAGFVLATARLIGGQRRWHGGLVIAAVLIYLALIEVHMPVLRAGVMTIAASLGLISGRRLRAGGLVSLSAILLLLWRPDQLFNAGFQLTYGVVLGLIYLAPPLRKRWFGEPNHEAASAGEMLGQWLRSTLAVSIAAWVVATPIALYHFGMISPFGAVMSLVAIPLSALILALGFVKIVLSAILPSAALLLGIPLSISADVLLSIVKTVDAVPGSVVPLPYPSTVWSLAALAWACWWLRGKGIWRLRDLAIWRLEPAPASLQIARSHSRRIAKWTGRVKLCALLALIVWLVWPMWTIWPRPAGPPLRIDMLAVGDGSCYVIRSGGSTVVFDAGSSTDLNVGRRSLIPALRRLGVRAIDAIAISHADMDHYSAALDLMDEFDVNEVLLTPQFMAEAKRIPNGPAAYAMEQMARRRVVVQAAAAGAARDFGAARWEWLNPRPDQDFEKANDNSMVIRITGAGRRAMLCGDIQRDAMERLMRSADTDQLHADIIELPHHGSHHDAAEAFIRRVHPRVVMQSTGWTRWQRDRWAAALADAERLVTVRDGACWVEIGRDGGIAAGRFLSPGQSAGDVGD